MSGWSHDKRLRIEKAFYEFLDHCFIYSKDISGQICLGKELYDGQIVFITEVFDALERDVHKIYCLKSRQLGISTVQASSFINTLGAVGIDESKAMQLAAYGQFGRSRGGAGPYSVNVAGELVASGMREGMSTQEIQQISNMS